MRAKLFLGAITAGFACLIVVCILPVALKQDPAQLISPILLLGLASKQLVS